MSNNKPDPVFSSMDDLIDDLRVFREDIYVHALEFIIEYCFQAVYTAEHRARLISTYAALLAYNQAINVCNMNELNDTYPNFDAYMDDIIKTGMSRWLFTINAVQSICGLELSRNAFLIMLFSIMTHLDDSKRPMLHPLVAAVYRYIKTEQENIQKEISALQTKTEPFSVDDNSNLVLGNLLKDFLNTCESIDMAAYAHHDETKNDEQYDNFKKVLTRLIEYGSENNLDKKEGEES